MSSLGEEVKDWLVAIVVAVVLAFVIRQFIVELYVVDGPSMRPTLQSRERLVVNKFIYRMREPERGEIIVFRYPRDPSRDFIKRVIAVPGDTIEIKERAKSSERYKEVLEMTSGRIVPTWLESDKENLKGAVKALPSREEIDVPVDELQIVELYSK